MGYRNLCRVVYETNKKIDNHCFHKFLVMRYIIILNFFVYLHDKIRLMMNRIREILEQKGIKQKWLAEQLGKSF